MVLIYLGAGLCTLRMLWKSDIMINSSRKRWDFYLMKRWARNTIGISIFLIILFAMLFAAWKFYVRGMQKIQDVYRTYVVDTLSEKLGLSISYGSFSPSIFSGAGIKDIQVFDEAGGRRILSVRKIVMNYKIGELISVRELLHARELKNKDWKDAFNRFFTRLTLYDVVFDFDMDRNASVIDKITSLSSGEEESEEPDEDGAGESDKSASEIIESLENALGDVLSFVPRDLRIKNIRAHFKMPGTDVKALVSEVNAVKDSETMNLDGVMNGSVFAEISALNDLGVFAGGSTAGVNFRGEFKLLKSLSGSSAKIELDDYKKADFSLKHVEVLSRYSEGNIEFRTTQKVYPYNIGADINLLAGDISGNIVTKGLDPFVLVRMPRLKGFPSKLYGLNLTMDASGKFNLNTLRYNYRAKGGLFLPSGIIGSSENFSYSVSGNNTDLYIDYFKAWGQTVGASLSGNLYIPGLKVSAAGSLDHYVLPTGAVIACDDLFVESTPAGYMAFIPQLVLGDNSLTAVEAEIDFPKGVPGPDFGFSVSMNDYSHTEYDKTGKLSVEGSCSFGRRQEVQMTLGLEYFFIDTLLRVGGYLGGEEVLANLASAISFTEPYLVSTEASVAIDFAAPDFMSDDFHVGFNIPSFLLANTRKDSEMILLSLYGNKQNISITQLEALYAGQHINAAADVDVMDDFSQIGFSTDFAFNNVNYSVSGAFAPGEWLHLTGSYGLDCIVNFTNPLTGNIQLVNFPVSIQDFLLSLSLDSYFEIDLANMESGLPGLNVEVRRLDIEDVNGKIPFNPKVNLSGKLDNTHFDITSFSYSDKTAALMGDGMVNWILDGGIFEKLDFRLDASNEGTEESVKLEGVFENPEKLPFEGDNLQTKCKFNALADVSGLRMGRFLEKQTDTDVVDCIVTAEGTIENPFANVALKNFSMHAGDNALAVRGNVNYLEGNVGIYETEAEFSNMKFDDIQSSFNINDFAGYIYTNFNMTMGENYVNIPVNLVIQNDTRQGPVNPDGKSEKTGFIPDEFSMFLDCDSLRTSFFPKEVPLHFTIVHSPGMFALSSDLGLLAYYYTDIGYIEASVSERKPLHFNFNGTMDLKNSMLDMHLTDFAFDASKFDFLKNSSFSKMFSVYHGLVQGHADLTGAMSDLLLDGKFSVMNLDFNLPMFIPDHFVAKEMSIDVSQDRIFLGDTEIRIRDENLTAGAEALLDSWALTHASVWVRSNNKKGIPFDVDIPFLTVKGRTTIDANIDYAGNDLKVTGNINLSDAEISILDDISKMDFSIFGNRDRNADKSAKDKSKDGEEIASVPMNINLDVNLEIEQKVNLLINPLLRGMIAPRTPINLKIDTRNNLWSVQGDIELKGGEVFYLNRNFYLKEGRIILDENQNKFDPMVTLNAETREHDEDGSPVKISLEAIRQNVSNFKATLTSSPPKSETEILAILGQVAMGDSKSAMDFALSLGDYAVQSTILRSIEKSLRDLLNFDIFSLRTTFLKNVAKIGVSENVNFGNLFNDSTVYIGKYFGNSVYADALMQWTFDEKKLAENPSGLVFHPEIGIEFTAPFANIRWQFAPTDITNWEDSWVQATSVTLSWRLAF